MRLIVARCEVSYIGRVTTVLPEAVRLLMHKADGTFMVWADGGGPNVKPLNWMTPPVVLEEEHDVAGDLVGLVARKRRQEERLEIAVREVIADIEHELDTLVSLEKEGRERELQELLADAPAICGEGFRLVRREWPTDIGPVDLMCRDPDDGWVAVEIKRIGTIDSVEQLTRYLERIRTDPALRDCRGVLAAQHIKPQARVLAGARGIDCVEVDLHVLRGEREPELTLFAA
jgi:RecB family endonuclease NucS